MDGMIVFAGDKARFGRAAFFDAIRELYRSGDASATVKDDDGDAWSIERGEDAGRKILKVRNAQARFQLHGFVALQIGSALCRERVFPYVYISVDAVS